MSSSSTIPNAASRLCDDSYYRPGDIEVEGQEYVTTLAVVAMALAIAGPGEFALDHAIEFSGMTLAECFDGRVGTLLAVGAIAVAALQLATFWRSEVTD